MSSVGGCTVEARKSRGVSGDASRTIEGTPARARQTAETRPTGPAPTMMTRFRSGIVLFVDCFFWFSSWSVSSWILEPRSISRVQLAKTRLQNDNVGLAKKQQNRGASSCCTGSEPMDARTSRYHDEYERWRRDPDGVLGGRRARYRLVRAAQAGLRSRGWRLRPLVPGCRLQHLLERGRPPCDARARRAARDHLRFAAHRNQAHPHLRPPAHRGAGAGRAAARLRRGEGRPRRPLHADGAGSGDRHARLRPHRCRAFGGVRRLRRARACDPHRRRQAEGDPLRELRDRDRRPHRQIQAAARRGDRARFA